MRLRPRWREKAGVQVRTGSPAASTPVGWALASQVCACTRHRPRGCGQGRPPAPRRLGAPPPQARAGACERGEETANYYDEGNSSRHSLCSRPLYGQGPLRRPGAPPAGRPPPRPPARLPSSSQSRRVSGSLRATLPTRSGGRGRRRAARPGGGPGGRAQAAAARRQCSRSASGSSGRSSASSAARGPGASSAQNRRRCSWPARRSRARTSRSEAMSPPPAAGRAGTRDPQGPRDVTGPAQAPPPVPPRPLRGISGVARAPAQGRPRPGGQEPGSLSPGAGSATPPLPTAFGSNTPPVPAALGGGAVPAPARLALAGRLGPETRTDSRLRRAARDRPRSAPGPGVWTSPKPKKATPHPRGPPRTLGGSPFTPLLRPRALGQSRPGAAPRPDLSL